MFQLKEMTNSRNRWMSDICQRFGGFDNFFNSAGLSRFQKWFIKHGTASQETTAPGGKYSNHVESGYRHAKWRNRCLSGVLPQVHRWSTKRADEDFLLIGVLRRKFHHETVWLVMSRFSEAIHWDVHPQQWEDPLQESVILWVVTGTEMVPLKLEIHLNEAHLLHNNGAGK